MPDPKTGTAGSLGNDPASEAFVAAPDLRADVDAEGEPICSVCGCRGEILEPISARDHRLLCEDCQPQRPALREHAKPRPQTLTLKVSLTTPHDLRALIAATLGQAIGVVRARWEILEYTDGE